MSSSERGFLDRVREDRQKLQPLPHLREKTLERIKTEDREKRRIEKSRTKSLHYLEQSGIVLLLKELEGLVDGIILEGRVFFENRGELRVPRDEETYPLTIPLSEESVVSTFLWDSEEDQNGNEVFASKAIVIEAFPDGNIFIYGNPVWGTSHSTLRERNADKDLLERMLGKAYQTPKIAHYYLDNEQPRLIYHSMQHEEEAGLF